METKITTFKDIPKFIWHGSYQVDIMLRYLPEAINGYIKDYNLNMSPDYQRGHVWTRKQQKAYVEYLLKGGMSSRNIYFNCPGWGTTFEQKMELVDGKQRITALLLFLNNEFPVFNSFYNEFTDKIDSCNTVKFCINCLKKKSEVIQWYIEMNAGGVVHTDEEIEKARNLMEEALKEEK